MSRKVVNRTIAFEEWVCDDVPSPLGRISIGGLVTHRGIPAHAMRVLGEYALIYLLKGGGSFCDSHHQRAEVRPGTLLLLFPGVGHAYGPPPGGLWRELFLHFEGPLFELLQARGVLDERRPIHHALPVDKWQERLLELAHTPRLAREVDTTAKIFRLANLLSQITSDEPSLPPPEEWFQHACRLLKGNISEPFDLNLVAQAVGMSYHSFREKFRERSGVPPARYRMQERIAVARRMMEREELTGRAIAMALGFGDEANFSRRFKQEIGVSPRLYRQQLRDAATNSASEAS